MCRQKSAALTSFRSSKVNTSKKLNSNLCLLTAEALKLTADDMKKMKLIDGIIEEPLGGAHRDRETAFDSVKKTILSSFETLKKLDHQELVEKRMAKYDNMGEFSEG